MLTINLHDAAVDAKMTLSQSAGKRLQGGELVVTSSITIELSDKVVDQLRKVAIANLKRIEEQLRLDVARVIAEAAKRGEI